MAPPVSVQYLTVINWWKLAGPGLAKIIKAKG
ncbi:MAG: hypothetical protein ACI9J3_002038, partial [Parvicellaceae bacterium]